MKQRGILILITLVTGFNISSAQSIRIKWQSSLGGTYLDKGTHIEQTRDSGFICSGFSNSTDVEVTGNHGTYDYWLAKTKSDGAFKWGKSYGGSNVDKATAVKQTADRGYIVAGISSSVDGDVTGSHQHGSHNVLDDYWVVKTDSVGNIQWKYCYGGSGEDFCEDVELTSDGGYIICGNTSSYDGDVTGNKGLSN